MEPNVLSVSRSSLSSHLRSLSLIGEWRRVESISVAAGEVWCGGRRVTPQGCEGSGATPPPPCGQRRATTAHKCYRGGNCGATSVGRAARRGGASSAMPSSSHAVNGKPPSPPKPTSPPGADLARWQRRGRQGLGLHCPAQN
ncbi:hypothetical protein SEVIR_7G006205v4 [Setaria viridis]